MVPKACANEVGEVYVKLQKCSISKSKEACYQFPVLPRLQNKIFYQLCHLL